MSGQPLVIFLFLACALSSVTPGEILSPVIDENNLPQTKLNVNNSAFTLSFTSTLGHRYQWQTSQDLTPPWANYGEAFYGQGNLEEIQLPLEGNASFAQLDVTGDYGGGWVRAAQAEDGGEWSQDDLRAIKILVDAVEASPELSAAREAGTLLILPLRGPNAASRKRCLYHPDGDIIAMTATLPDSAFQEDGLHGDGIHHADTLYDGDGLTSYSVSFLVQGKNFETLYCDPRRYIFWGQTTKINGNTGVKTNTYSNEFEMGSTYNFSQGGTIRHQGYPSGSIGLVSKKTQGSPVVDDYYRLYFNSDLLEEHIHAQTGAWYGGYPAPSSYGTFKLLSDGDDDSDGSNAILHTVVLCPALSDDAYLALQNAIASANADRKPYKDVAPVSSPVNIWIFAGQSNCAGDQVNIANSNNYSVFPEDEWHPNIWQWARTGDLAGTPVPASHPLNFDGGGAPVGVGPAMVFAKTLLDENPYQRILIIPAAVGATGFSSNDWNPGDPVYEAMVTMVNEAIVETGGTVCGMIWNQGEGDKQDSTTNYANNWMAMFNDFTSRIQGGWPDDAVVIYGQLPDPTLANFWNTIKDSLLPQIPRSSYVTKAAAGINTAPANDAENLEVYDDLSRVHYSAKSQRLMGAAYAASIADALANQ